MRNLIKKDLLMFVLIIVPSQLILSFVWLLIFMDLNVLIVLIQTTFVFLIIFVITSHSEQVEETNHGYEFLRNMPVSTFQIVGAKFILIFYAAAFLGLSNIILFNLFSHDLNNFKISISAMMLACCAALLFSALVNIGIFTLGMENFLKAFSFLIVALAVVFTIYMKGVKLDANSIVEMVIRFIENANILFYIILTLTLYLGLMWVAVFTRKLGWQIKT